MKTIYKFIQVIIVSSILLFSMSCQYSQTKTTIENLHVEYMENPIGIDVAIPRFSWQMKVEDDKRGYFQTAYQLIVTNPKGEVVWDSEKIMSSKSLNIEYSGSKLNPATCYNWTVTVWDQQGETSKASSWFETGLMNPDPELSAWDGATWIGGSEEDLVLYSPYLSVFKFQYKIKLDRVSDTQKAGFLFGANDSRLMDKNKNIFFVESEMNENYVKLELDISNLSTPNGLAQFNIYRVGYHPEDKPNEPYKSLAIPLTLINNDNKYNEHQIFVDAVFGIFNIYIGGNQPENKITKREDTGTNAGLNLNPVGNGNNHISFPMLAEIGFSADAGQKASFSALEIRNHRSPSNILFSEDFASQGSYSGIFSEFVHDDASALKIKGNAYVIDGGTKGVKFLSNPSRNSMPMLRTTFETNDKQIEQARLYVTSRGIYEIYINGKRVGNDYFNPGLTQYNKTHMYQTYDLTGKIKQGDNAIGAMLGEGWWSGNITYSGESWNFFGDRQSLLAKLVITYADGTNKVITTDPKTWTYYNDGPIVYSSFFQGEVYNASKDKLIDGWNTSTYDDSKWEKAVEVNLNGTICVDQSFGKKMGMAPVSNYDNMSLIGQYGENASVVEELTAIKVDEVRPGVYVYDMGQNMVGVPKVTINKGKAGEKVTLRFAEVKYPDLAEYGEKIGMIMLENIRAALTQDIYTLKEGNQVIEPRFTFHGYRYLEITGIDKALPLQSVKGKVISSVKELASSYETSNYKVNKLWENITWSTRGNFLSIPTDCPQRNERMGWSGDISVFSRTSTYLTDGAQFLRRHMHSMRDAQREDGRFTDVAPLGGGFGGILWGSAGITVAWEAWQQYGDKAMITEHYDAMKKYIAFLDTRIDPKTGVVKEGPLGDWLSPEGNKNDNTLIWEAYYVFDLEIMIKIADILGKTDDAALFRKKYDERKSFFNKTYVNAQTRKTIKSGFIAGRRPAVGDNTIAPPTVAGKDMDTQVSYAVPLALGVFNNENEQDAAKHLATAVMRKNKDDGGATRPAYSLMTGFIGTAWINIALSDYGYNHIAYRLLQQSSYPSWLYSVDQGATTIWERLNSYTVEDGFGGNNGMNSFNHYSFGAVGAWLYNYSLGIQRDEKEPGFKHFILQPTPDPDGIMTFAKGHYDSMYGKIESGWRLENDKIIYSATVPANTTATLYLPALSEQDVTESSINATNAEGVEFIKYENDRVVYQLQSGSYSFEFNKISLSK